MEPIRRALPHSEYIEARSGAYYVAGTRVSLDSIVYSFKAGDSPETSRQNFASLTLEQVNGAITFYLAHEQEVDTNLAQGEKNLDCSVLPLSESRPELYARLKRARQELTVDLARSTLPFRREPRIDFQTAPCKTIRLVSVLRRKSCPGASEPPHRENRTSRKQAHERQARPVAKRGAGHRPCEPGFRPA